MYLSSVIVLPFLPCCALSILRAHGDDAYVIGEIVAGEEKIEL